MPQKLTQPHGRLEEKPIVKWYHKKDKRFVYDQYLNYNDITLMLLFLDNWTEIKDAAEMFHLTWADSIEDDHVVEFWHKLSALEERIDSDLFQNAGVDATDEIIDVTIDIPNESEGGD